EHTALDGRARAKDHRLRGEIAVLRGLVLRVKLLQPRMLAADRLDERVPFSFVSGEAAGVHEAADVGQRAFDGVDAEVAFGERVEVDVLRVPCSVFRVPIVAFEAEVAVGVIGDEAAVQLLVESAPAAPRTGDDFRVELLEARDGHAVRAFRAALHGGAEQEIVEEEAGDAAGGMGERELVRPFRPDDAAALDVRRAGAVDLRDHAEGLEDGERVVGKKLAAQLVARKDVAIVNGDARAAAGEQRGERRAGGAGADDGYVFHSRMAKRNGQTRTTARRAAATRSTIARTSASV